MSHSEITGYLRHFFTNVRERGVIVTVLGAVRVLLSGLIVPIEITSTRLKLVQTAFEFSEEYNKPLGRCLWIAFRGYHPKYYFLHNLDEKSSDTYVSRAYTAYAGKRDDGPVKNVNKNARHVLNDKLAIYEIFDEIAEYFPEIYGTIHDGRYFPQTDTDTESVLDAIDHHQQLVIKPPDRAQGRGFHVLSKTDQNYAIDGTEASEADIERLLDDDLYQNAIIMEYVDQHHYSSEIYPETTNTVRLLTVIDRKTGDPRVARPVHRFGTGKSYPVDNFDEGGVLAPIDVDTGRMEGIVTLDKRGNRVSRHTHPETEAQVAGVEIPKWDSIIDIVEKGAKEYRSARIIGWDIVIGEDQPYILEASGMPSIAIPQVHGGLLEDESLRYHIERA